MPSELFHMGLACIVAVALLDEVGVVSLGVVVGAATVPDLDTFLGLFFEGAHRSYFHSLPFVVLVSAGVVYAVRKGYVNGARKRLAYVAVVSLGIAGVAPDLFYNGVNLFYPFHDGFYSLSGGVYFSLQRGFFGDLVSLSGVPVGTTETVHYSTGVDPSSGSDRNVERVFLVFSSGINLLITAVGFGLAVVRLRWSDSG